MTTAIAATDAPRRGDWIRTAGGGRFWPLDPRPEEVDIREVAHALANLCRFTGHTRDFYSVGQHSVLVAMLCPPEARPWGLLHDASEAYIADVSRPVKHAPEMAPYRAIEADLTAAIFRRFGLDPAMPASVKRADDVLCVAEARQLVRGGVDGWGDWVDAVPAYGERIVPWAPWHAEYRFLTLFNDLFPAHAVELAA